MPNHALGGGIGRGTNVGIQMPEKLRERWLLCALRGQRLLDMANSDGENAQALSVGPRTEMLQSCHRPSWFSKHHASSKYD